MIHQLVVEPNAEVKETKKLARKLAMTGGYEVQIAETLSFEQLESLYLRWSPELSSYEKGSAAYSSSIAARTLLAIESHPNASPELVEKVRQHIES